MPNPEECKYTKAHEWAYIEGDIAIFGISEFAQKEVGDIVFIELPKIGQKVEKGEQCAVVESVKAASDFYAPLSGEVTEINEKLNDDPSTVNKSAHQEGWFFKIKISNSDEIKDLMNLKEYEEFIKSQAD